MATEDTAGEGRLASYRSFYARLITSAGDAGTNERLREAFATTQRERFAGSGPWRIYTQTGYIDTPSDDPAFLYQDVVVSLKGAVNNGQPSLHAACLHALSIEEGERIVHIGAGTGYYTALLAHLTGKTGSVRAFEIDEELGLRAQENLRDLHQVHVQIASGTSGGLPPCDVVYVNAGATHPLDAWLDALSTRGRLLFPLTPNEGFGGMLLVTRAEASWAAKFLFPVMFIGCQGARDSSMERKLATVFKSGMMRQVQSLRRSSEPDDSCWIAGKEWWLSTAPPG